MVLGSLEYRSVGNKQLVFGFQATLQFDRGWIIMYFCNTYGAKSLEYRSMGSKQLVFPIRLTLYILFGKI